MNSDTLREFESERVVEGLEGQGDHLWIPIGQIFRASLKRLDEKKVRMLVEHLLNGGVCKPIIVVEVSFEHFCINGDGRHRYEAHRRADFPMIFCRIVRR